MMTTGKHLGANSVFCEATTHSYSFFSHSMLRDLQTNHSKFTPSLPDYSGGTGLITKISVPLGYGRAGVAASNRRKIYESFSKYLSEIKYSIKCPVATGPQILYSLSTWETSLYSLRSADKL